MKNIILQNKIKNILNNNKKYFCLFIINYIESSENLNIISIKKKISIAVYRNKIRRRIKSAIRMIFKNQKHNLFIVCYKVGDYSWNNIYNNLLNFYNYINKE